MFIGTKSSNIWSRIYEEYQSLAKKIHLIIITEEVFEYKREGFFIIKIPKFSSKIVNLMLRSLVITYAAIKHRKKYELVFIRVLDYPFMFTGIITKKILKKKLFIWISNTETTYTGIKNKIYKSLYKKTLFFADVICISSSIIIEDIQKYIGTIDESKIFVIKKGIDTDRFKPMNTPKNKNEILYVGRISKIKNIDEIIRALSIVLESIPDAKLRLIGNIEQQCYFNDLKELIKELDCEKNVEFVGPVEYEKLVSHYNSANVFILISQSETISQVTLEAMACQLPVIVTPRGMLNELIIDGKNGFFVKTNQPQLLAEKIISLLQNQDLQEKIGSEARETVINLPSTDSFAEEFDNLISKKIFRNQN